jgi:hypothetical protein
MGKSTGERQRIYRENQRGEGKEYISIWVSKKERKIIDTYKKKLNTKYDSLTISTILNEYHRIVTGNKGSKSNVVTGNDKSKPKDATGNTKSVTGNKKKKRTINQNLDRYDIEQNKKTHELISKLLDEGMSYQKMSDYFNENKVPTLSGKGKWTKGTIFNFMKRNPDYLKK